LVYLLTFPKSFAQMFPFFSEQIAQETRQGSLYLSTISQFPA
jgi:hypothetical protein